MRKLFVCSLLVLSLAACSADPPTAPDSDPLLSRDVPGLRTAIVASGLKGSDETGTYPQMDLWLGVYSGPEDDYFPTQLVEGGVLTIEEYFCRDAKVTPGHPDGLACKWQTYVHPETDQVMKNLEANELILFAVPYAELRATYKARGYMGAEDVLRCPWPPLEFIYKCFSDGT